VFDSLRSRLYANDSFVASYVFQVQSDLTLTDQRVLLEKHDADGMALDADGNVWITGFRSSEIVRLSPDGEQLPPFRTPGGAVTQVRFGGPDMRDVYFNTVPADAGDGLAVGELPTAKTSMLYRGRSETPGLQLPPPRFNLA
jgi:sugar lactone lactonase YvrE